MSAVDNPRVRDLVDLVLSFLSSSAFLKRCMSSCMLCTPDKRLFHETGSK